MRIQNTFRLGLFVGLGFLLALAIGAALQSISTILTYIGIALFLALGIDPAVSWLQRRRLPRPVAVLIVFVGILGVFTGLVFAIIPVVVDQVNRFIAQLPAIEAAFKANGPVQTWLEATFPSLDVNSLVSQLTDYLTKNAGSLGGGVASTAFSVANAAFGLVVVLILTLYFVASLRSIKEALYKLVPASKRTRFIDLAEQISQSVGRYVMGQVTLALCNGVLSFIFLTFIVKVNYSALLAFIAFTGSLIPLVGSISAATIITLLTLAFNGWPSAVTVLIYYLVYMQVEAYILSPNIMKRAVRVPGVVVVIAALTGGTLLGLLGALIALPGAAAVLLIVNQVLIPRQNEL